MPKLWAVEWRGNVSSTLTSSSQDQTNPQNMDHNREQLPMRIILPAENLLETPSKTYVLVEVAVADWPTDTTGVKPRLGTV